jgi:nucleoside-triphosphatase THEP1
VRTVRVADWRGNLKWRRAAALGSVWAASEIILGSFLHNLKVPFRGHALTAIAVLLLAGAQRRWGQGGVVVRAGLVAAIMKSASPSAVLLGPMLAIGMEGAAFEAGLGIGRGGWLGCLLGGALAMSWTFVHLLLSLLLSYGANLVDVYRQLVAMAGRELPPLPLGSAGPIVALAALNMAVGVAAAAVGWRAGGRRSAAGTIPAGTGATTPRRPRGAVVEPRLAWLVLTLVALPVGLVALSRVPLAGACLGMGVVFSTAALRYRTALRRLARPGFWGGVLVIAATAALVGRYGSGVPLADALAVAVTMTLRAAFVAACFAAIDVELAHPRLRAALQRHGAGPLLGATEAAFATLPTIVASVPSGRELLRRPGAALASMLPRLDELVEGFAGGGARVVILTGERGAGKTTLVARTVETLRSRGLRVGGVLTPGSWRDGGRQAFDVVDLASGERAPFAHRLPREGWIEERGFWVNPEALALGRAALSRNGLDLVVVDEIGPWELDGRGWAAELAGLVAQDGEVLLVARRECLEDAVARWRLDPVRVLDVAETDAAELAAALTAAHGGAS